MAKRPEEIVNPSAQTTWHPDFKAAAPPTPPTVDGDGPALSG
jgi:hypothetical protein